MMAGDRRRRSESWVQWRARGCFALGLVLVLWTAVSAAGAPSSPWPDMTRKVSGLLDEAAKAYEEKEPERAKDLVSEAYFDAFEESGMEDAIRQQMSARRARELEEMFSEIRQTMGQGQPADWVRQQIATLRRGLEQDARELVRLSVTNVSMAEKENSPVPEGQAESFKMAPGAILKELGARLDEASEKYHAGDGSRAKTLLGSAYFDLFEGRGLEAAVGAKSSQRKAEIEGVFTRIRGLMTAHAPADKVSQELETLKDALREAAALLSRNQSRLEAFLNSLIIIVREGFEAILIITALVAYLLKSGNSDKVRVVYQAGGAAIVGSVLTAVLIQTLFQTNPRHQEILEGATMLLATAILFYVSYWLTSKAEASRWQQYIQKRVQASLSTGSLIALWCAAFLAVYREGAETVLFYQALLAGTDAGVAGAVLGGLGVGASALVLVFFLLRSGAVRIPIRLFFSLTSALLYYLAFVFAGRGIRELQGSGLIGITRANWIPSWGSFGLYPTWEGLGLQILLVGAAAFAFGYLFLIQGRRARAQSN